MRFLSVLQMEKDIRDISMQRDLAESRVEDLLLVIQNLKSPEKTVSVRMSAVVC